MTGTKMMNDGRCVMGFVLRCVACVVWVVGLLCVLGLESKGYAADQTNHEIEGEVAVEVSEVERGVYERLVDGLVEVASDDEACRGEHWGGVLLEVISEKGVVGDEQMRLIGETMLRLAERKDVAWQSEWGEILYRVEAAGLLDEAQQRRMAMAAIGDLKFAFPEKVSRDYWGVTRISVGPWDGVGKLVRGMSGDGWPHMKKWGYSMFAMEIEGVYVNGELLGEVEGVQTYRDVRSKRETSYPGHVWTSRPGEGGVGLWRCSFDTNHQWGRKCWFIKGLDGLDEKSLIQGLKLDEENELTVKMKVRYYRNWYHAFQSGDLTPDFEFELMTEPTKFVVTDEVVGAKVIENDVAEELAGKLPTSLVTLNDQRGHLFRIVTQSAKGTKIEMTDDDIEQMKGYLKVDKVGHGGLYANLLLVTDDAGEVGGKTMMMSRGGSKVMGPMCYQGELRVGDKVYELANIVRVNAGQQMRQEDFGRVVLPRDEKGVIGELKLKPAEVIAYHYYHMDEIKGGEFEYDGVRLLRLGEEEVERAQAGEKIDLRERADELLVEAGAFESRAAIKAYLEEVKGKIEAVKKQ